MSRSFRGWRITTCVAIAAASTLAWQPLVAAGFHESSPSSGSNSTWSVQIFDKAGTPRDLPAVPPTETRKESLKPTEAQLRELRQELTLMKLGANPAYVARAERMLNLLDIITSKSRSERHEKIQKLGVAVTSTPALDGRVGTIKTFSLAGKPRARIFVPARSSVPGLVHESASLGGPFVPEDGRWKSDGNGGCYWDANDSGPDQCDPTSGRWKSDGFGNCYWDANDSGSDQCQGNNGENGPGGATEPVCYYQGEPDTCASAQDGEDNLALVVSLDADIADAQAQYDETVAYCNQYGCNEPAPVSGPSGDGDLMKGCGEKLTLAVLEGVTAGFARYALYATAADIAGGAIVATGLLAATAMGAVFAVGLFAYAAVEAYHACHRYEPIEDNEVFSPRVLNPQPVF